MRNSLFSKVDILSSIIILSAIGSISHAACDTKMAGGFKWELIVKGENRSLGIYNSLGEAMDAEKTFPECDFFYRPGENGARPGLGRDHGGSSGSDFNSRPVYTPPVAQEIIYESEPSKLPGERYQYQVISKQTEERSTLGSVQINGANLSKNSTSLTLNTAAQNNVTIYERVISPCVSININGRGDDPNKCKPIKFKQREAIPAESLELQVKLSETTLAVPKDLSLANISIGLNKDKTLSVSMIGSATGIVGAVVDQNTIIIDFVASEVIKSFGPVDAGLLSYVSALNNQEVVVSTKRALTQEQVNMLKFKVKIERKKFGSDELILQKSLDSGAVIANGTKLSIKDSELNKVRSGKNHRVRIEAQLPFENLSLPIGSREIYNPAKIINSPIVVESEIEGR